MPPPTPRELVERNAFNVCFIGGIGTAAILYAIGAYEQSVMFAMFMPGVYWGFAFIAGDWLEVLQETVTMVVLINIFCYCFHQIIDHHNHDDPNGGNQEGVGVGLYYGPLSIGIHGFVDLLHHFQLYPSEKHVHTCCPKYPLLCGLFDLTTCVTMCLLIYFGSSSGK